MIDKSGWKRVKFGDVVKNINLTQKHFPNEKFEKVIGLDHIDKENLHVDRWDEYSEGTSFTKVLHKGQTLFGKRRSYQKKIAIAEFDGICSGDILVFDSKSAQELLTELIPFICISDDFYNFVEANSQGSLSPRVSFKALAQYEFSLPPIEEQKRIAELLWAADKVMTTKKELLLALTQTYKSLINKLLFYKAGKNICMNDMADFNVATLQAKSVDPQSFINYIDISSIIKPKHIGDIRKIEFNKAPSRARRIAKSGDILISTVRPNLQSFYQIEQGEYIVSTGFAVATPKSALWGKTLYHALFSDAFLSYCENKSIGTNYPAINVKDIKEFKLSINPNVSVEESVHRLQEIQESMDDAERNVFDSESIKKILVNKLIGGAN